MILFPSGKFIHNYIFRLGFLDGMEGFIHAGMMSGHSFLVRGESHSRKSTRNVQKLVKESTKMDMFKVLGFWLFFWLDG